ncbi:hypothetical protein Tco_0759406 [Tanacetum coccineum]
MDKSNAWRSVAQDIKLSAAKEAVKAMRSLQAIIQYIAQICFEESLLNWKPLPSDWAATTSKPKEVQDNTLEDNMYRYNRKGFLEDDDSSDDLIFIIDPGWDDYCLQELKLNHPECLGTLCFQPLFDEYFNPPPSVVSPVLAVAAPEPVDSTGTPSSTKIDQDTPSLSTSQTPLESSSIVIPPGSSSRDVIPTNVHSINRPLEHISKWSKDHPLNNIIGYPSRPVTTRLQLQTEALFCYFDAFLSSVKPKSYKEALTESLSDS